MASSSIKIPKRNEAARRDKEEEEDLEFGSSLGSEDMRALDDEMQLDQLEISSKGASRSSVSVGVRDTGGKNKSGNRTSEYQRE